MELDIKDRKILTLLDMNGRMPLSSIAKKAGISKEVAQYRIRRMQENAALLGFMTIFDSVVAGFSWYRVLLRLKNITRLQKDEFVHELAAHPHMCWLGEIGGNWDLAMNFIAKDNFEFNRIFEKLLQDHGKTILNYEILIYLDLHDYERAYLQGKPMVREEFFHEMKQKEIKLDKLDKSIIRLFSINARTSLLEAEGKLGSTRLTIRRRLDWMAKEGLLLGFRAMISPQKLGRQSFMLFLGMHSLDLQREKELYSYLKILPQVTFVVKHIGRWRIGMEIEAESQANFQEIFVELRARFSDIISDFESFPILKDYVVNYFPSGNLK